MALIKQNFIDKIIYQSDIVAVIGAYVQLNKAGANFSALSPFTNEKTASFMVNPKKQNFNDYSSGYGGNVIKFIQLKEKCNFPEAVKILADKLNLSVDYESEEYSKKQKVKINALKENLPVLQFTQSIYHSELQKLDDSHPAKTELLNRRNYNDDLITNWRLGYAPGNRFLFNKLKEKGWIQLGQKLGLLSENNDKYFNRVVYPIQNHLGNIVGLAGRSVKEKNNPKWINPSSSIVYEKNFVLFGLHNAIPEISKKGEVWLVEGYNDVIAWQENGIENTVGICGTALTQNQIKLIKRYCNKVILCMDGDQPGIKSIIKKVTYLIKEGFQTEVVQLPQELDPDDYVRKFTNEIKSKGLISSLKLKSKISEGFKYLMNEKLTGSDFTIATEARNLSNLIAEVKNDTHRTVYLKTLTGNKKILKKDVDRWIKEKFSNASNLNDFSQEHEKYNLPKEVVTPLKDLLPQIDRYGIFMDSNKIYSLRSSSKSYFQVVSNFEIEIIQHMLDEKQPMKLVRIKNVRGQEKVFDVLSEYLNTPQKFDNTVTGHGNFLWDGNTMDFQKLRAYLFDNMGTGQKIEVLGWQPNGFWIWNNQVVHMDGRFIDIDKNGIFKLDEVCYYIPSANSVYRNNQFKFEPQKRFVVSNKNIEFTEFSTKIVQVHKDHGIIALLFSIASIYQDFIEQEIGGFPILFLFGEPSSGKDRLTHCCQSFFGKPQAAINLESGASTIKGQMRTLAQFSNGITQFSEYKRDRQQNDGMLKGIWDRRGYVRGNINSHVGTDTIPILNSVVLTGNEYPYNEALNTRLIWCEMNKREFSNEDIENYNKLEELLENGVSHLTNTFVQKRKYFIIGFKSKIKLHKNNLKKILPDAHSRILENTAILMATYDICKDVVIFPFNYDQVLNSTISSLKNQMRKLTSANQITKFWDCFLLSMRGNYDSRLKPGQEFKLDGNTIIIQFTTCYLKIQKEWFTLFSEQAPSKSSIMEALKKDIAFKGNSKVRLGIGDSNSSKSVFVMDLNKIEIADDIRMAVNWQETHMDGI